MTEKKVSQSNSVTGQMEGVSPKKKISVESMIKDTEAGAIWSEIKDKPIEIFALPDQKISQHAAPALVEPSKLYLTVKATSVLPAIETAIGKKFTVELADKYVVVSRTVIPITQR